MGIASADRDRLLAALASHLRLVAEDGITEALRAADLDPSAPFAFQLVNRDLLAETVAEALERLADAYLKATRGDRTLTNRPFGSWTIRADVLDRIPRDGFDETLRAPVSSQTSGVDPFATSAFDRPAVHDLVATEVDGQNDLPDSELSPAPESTQADSDSLLATQREPDPHSTQVIPELAGSVTHTDLPRTERELDPYSTHADSGSVPSTEREPDPLLTQADLALGTGTRPQDPPSSVVRKPLPGVRFHIVRSHAQGGLGEVFVAVDAELNREVALKEIKARFRDHAESQDRFRFEAEVTGGLEHPGIVPVYALGDYGDGRPYYAMRFIRGETFQHALDRYHKAKSLPGDAGERAVLFRLLITRFVAVCQAIAYAHSRGVLHRDLKPANIMLGPYGETLVVDWGLAKLLDRPDLPPEPDTRPIEPLSGSRMAPSLAGSIQGTPAYMSPEQAQGSDDLGPACDIYSLGATLYQIVTGKSPFIERDLHVLLDRVRKGDFPPPRQVDRTLHPALEAICLKAMAREPSDRYNVRASDRR